MTTPQTVFLSGATGAIGRFAVPALVGAGHRVRAVARTDDKAAWLSSQGADPVRVSIFDRAALEEVVAGHDAVVNIATRIPPVRRSSRPSAWAENDRIRREASAALAAAAEAAGVGRYVQESITFLYADRGDEWIDEDSALDVPPALASVLAAEESAARFTAAGGTGVVLRFAALYGHGSEQTDVQARMARRHVAFVAGRPGDRISTLHLADAGSAVVAALSAPAGTYNVSDDEPLTKRQLAAAVGAAVGARPWFSLPGRLTRLTARGPMAAIARSHRVANGRFRAATGWAPAYPSARAGWSAYAAGVDDPGSSAGGAGTGDRDGGAEDGDARSGPATAAGSSAEAGRHG